MKKYAYLGVALTAAHLFPAARAADTCAGIALTNGHGIPQVVYGQTLDLLATGLAPASHIYLDGVSTAIITDFNDPPLTAFTTAIELIDIPYGAHTLQVDGGICFLSFSNIQPPAAPGTPSLSTNRTDITGGSYTLSWTVPSGSIHHYTLHKVASGGAVSDTTYPSNATAVTLTGSAPPGTSRVLTYTLRACSTVDETSCSSWSNSVEISIDPPCVGRCQ